jgi:hypothetical protein
MRTPTCLHCGADCTLHYLPLKDGTKEKRHAYVCSVCPDSLVWCHKGKTISLGSAANKATRKKRHLLHQKLLDPLWLNQRDRPTARPLVYRFLALKMGMPTVHVGNFTADQCDEAWLHLSTETMSSIRAFIKLNDPNFKKPVAYLKRIGKPVKQRSPAYRNREGNLQ